MTHLGNTGGGDDQSAVISFLSNPQNYPKADAVKLIGTHAAIVFLAGDRAYKLKRAVKLPYLDFSTLEKRRAVIERELEINSRATPELYLSIMPLTRSPDGSLELGGSGIPVDWLLVMRRFGQDALLHKMACEGRLTRELVMELANTIEHFHRHAPVIEKAGFAHSLEHIVADIQNALCGPVAQARGVKACSYIENLRHELSSKLAIIEEREREGFVRRCHGDLHLKNIVLWEGRPRLFDAIEFDDRLATIDVFYDLAFLLMDLWHRGLRREANVILNHYLQCASIREIQGLALLPLFISFRSAIRAMTDSMRLPYAARLNARVWCRKSKATRLLLQACFRQASRSLSRWEGFRAWEKAPWRGRWPPRSVLPPARFTFGPTSNARSCTASPSPTAFRWKPTRQRAGTRSTGESSGRPKSRSIADVPLSSTRCSQCLRNALSFATLR